VPAEYREIGAPPTPWFIDELMKFYQQAYYVGLLSAAALYGAAHQQPQVFQVITNKHLRPVQAGRSFIEFFTKQKILENYSQSMKTPTGYMQVSWPEITALDLVRYAKASGHLNNVTTVLSELQENFNMQRFKQIIETKDFALPEIQRLGYLLELSHANNEIIELLQQWIQAQKPRAIPLRPDMPYEKSQLNLNWQLYINEEIELDL
jgi:predicted transcriptional regulator of viral defense system